MFSSTSRGSVSVSEGLHDDWVQQGHVLGSSDWQLVCSVVMDDLGDGGEGRAVLPQHETAVCGLGELHVHEALKTPDRESRETGTLVCSYPNRSKQDFCGKTDDTCVVHF